MKFRDVLEQLKSMTDEQLNAEFIVYDGYWGEYVPGSIKFKSTLSDDKVWVDNENEPYISY